MDWHDLGTFLFRWLHLLFGVIWMGLLYYFNFVQGEYLKDAEKHALIDVKAKLIPRALWWFRWGAAFTLASGLVLLAVVGHQGVLNAYTVLAASLGTLMFLNVWLIILPNQRIVLGEVAGDAAAAAAKAGLISRTNVLYSGPMAFGMLGSAHLGYDQRFLLSGDGISAGLWLALLLIAALQVNGMMGKMGPMATTRGVAHLSVGLTALLFGLLYL